MFFRNERPSNSTSAAVGVTSPAGSSDDAFEDPTHVRQIFCGSFGYFSQPYYWRADYGFRGDWMTDAITLQVAPNLAHLPDAELWDRIHRDRNVVVEMVATLRCVKPIRSPLRELQVVPQVSLLR